MTVFPLKISINQRYLVDSSNKPFFFHGDTCWKLFWEFNKDDVIAYFDNRQEKGFTAVQVQLLPHRDYQANRDGNNPFLERGKISKPNPAYFDHVDWVIEQAKERDIGIIMSPAWASVWEQDWYKHYDRESATAFCRYLAERYNKFSNIIGWIHGGDDDAVQLHDTTRECGKIFKQIAPHQLNMFHANQKGAWEFFLNEAWYDVNMAYSYEYSTLCGQMKEAYALKPAKPVFMAETHYEYNDKITSAIIRKYAYASVVLGGMGHTYGNKEIWIATCFWRAAMNAPAVAHMSHLKALFTSVAWYDLIPDIAHNFYVEGSGQTDETEPVAAVHDGNLGIVYLPSRQSLTLNLEKFGNDTRIRWFDPTSGLYIDMGTKQDRQKMTLQTPGKNSDGDEDWVLLLKA